MTKEEIKDYSIDNIKILFKQHLLNSNISERTVNTRFSQAFYLTRHTNLNFLELLASDDFENTARKEIYNALIKNSEAKNIQSEVSTHYGHLSKLRDFLLHTDKIAVVKPERKATTKKSSVSLPNPDTNQVKKYLSEWDKLENYTAQEAAINKLFLSTYPNNDRIEEVLAKVAILNDFYSTNIFSTYPVAKHIVNLKIDSRLKAGDLSLVSEIAKIDVNGKTKNFYSFATKYCSHHNETAYPICDVYVKRVLIYFRNTDGFSVFKSSELNNYSAFVRIINDFILFYRLEEFTIKEIDKYLWLLGKEYIPKKYKKKSR